MKKRMFLFLCVLTTFSLLMGCVKKTESGAVADEGAGLIVYTQKTLDQYFHVALQANAENAVKSAGYNFEAANCNFDSALQTDQLMNFLLKNPVAVIANPVDSDSLVDTIARTKAQGIPVVVVDNPSTSGSVDVTVTFDNEKCGYMAGTETAKRLITKYGSAKGRVVNVYGAMSSESWRLRKEGFDRAMAEYPGIEYITVPGEGMHTKSQDALTNAIAQYGTIDAVHCPSDAPALGLVEALKIAGMWHKIGEAGHVIFVSADGEPEALKNVKDGYYDLSIVEDAMAYGPMAVDMLTQYVFQGKTVPTSGTYTNDAFYWKTAQFSSGPTGPVLTVPPYVIDSSNISDPTHWAMVATNGKLTDN